MKNLYKNLNLLLFAFLFALTASAQPKMSKKALAEFNRIVAENNALKGKVDSLNTAISGHIAAYDSLNASINIPAEGFSVDNADGYFVSDSLLREWFVVRQNQTSLAYDMDSVLFTSNVPDEVFEERLKAINSFIPLAFNQTVKNYCIVYSEKSAARLANVLGDCQYYWPIFDEILSHYDIPLELKALVIVESMMNPKATSRVGAKGLWQFMYTTAKGYGMTIDSFMDERMDPVQSTIGAARYLKDAYKLFGDWALAIASYNCGAGNVNKAIRRSGGKRDFWQIYDYLPRETRGYVPAFIGALYACHYYKEYGIVPAPSAIAVPVDTFMISRNLHYDQISAVVGVPGDLIDQLNPMYLHKIIPGDSRACVLRIPMEYSNAFVDAGDSLYMYKRDSLLDPASIKKIKDGISGNGNRIVYKVKSGDVLGKIARRYGVTVAQIKQWNSLKSNTIRIGQNLVIYTRKG